ncbi:MAG: ribosomal-protein-alanine N-acetyltransferase [Candidatus Hecatellales archaeon]|mgnify:CR=1 FL=1|nr:MAG: ribosomal-protein-alanine N-acetyltransferase [Candidatus Hecatellales archaeon]
MENKPLTVKGDYKFRKFREEDLLRVVEINRLCLPENYSPFFFLELHKSYPETFIVAEYENNIVGYVMVRVETGFSDFHRFKITRKGHIVSIAVIPEHRLKGVGLTLMLTTLKNMVQYYRCQETYLEVRVSNTSAINLYRKLGYRQIRIIPHYYLDGEDALLMSRELKPSEEIFRV